MSSSSFPLMENRSVKNMDELNPARTPMFATGCRRVTIGALVFCAGSVPAASSQIPVRTIAILLRISFLLFHRPAELSYLFAQAVISAVHVDQQSRLCQLELARLAVQVFVVGLHVHHVGDEHVVRAQ